MKEILDIVDEQNAVIGTEEMLAAHEKKLLHRSAVVLVYKDNSYSELLLQKRSKRLKTNPGRWCHPGGHVKSGETTLETARREFCEEMLGKDDDMALKLEELFTMRKDADDDPEFLTVFRMIYPGPFSPSTDEVDEWQFMKVADVYKKINETPAFFSQTTIAVMQELFSQKK